MISRMKEIQQEVMVATWDNALLASTFLIIGICITLIITGLSNPNLSPNWLLIALISVLLLLFLLYTFPLFLDSIFFKGRRFTNKSKFITFLFSFFLFLILIIGLPLLLTFVLKININNPFIFYPLLIIIYGTPIFFGWKIYPKIKKFFLTNCPTLILKGILSNPKRNRLKIYKHWDTTPNKLKELDKKY